MGNRVTPVLAYGASVVGVKPASHITISQVFIGCFFDFPITKLPRFSDNLLAGDLYYFNPMISYTGTDSRMPLTVIGSIWSTLIWSLTRT